MDVPSFHISPPATQHVAGNMLTSSYGLSGRDLKLSRRWYASSFPSDRLCEDTMSFCSVGSVCVHMVTLETADSTSSHG